MSRPRVLFVTGTLGNGGAEKRLSTIATRLHHLGWDTAVLSVFEGGPWVQVLEEKKVPVFGLQLEDRSRIPLSPMAAAISRWRPEVVVGFGYDISIWACIAGALAGAKVRIAARGDCGLKRSHRRLPRWLECLSYQSSSAFVANSRAVKQSLIQDEGISPSEIRLISNGVGATAPSRGPELRKILGIGIDRFVVGQVANFWPYKNHLVLVRAARRIVSSVPHALFVLSGCPKPYLTDVRAEIDRLGMNDRFRIVNIFNAERNLVPAFDVGVSCSKTEGQSNFLLECMAAGKPVVASSVDGNRELLECEETGLLFPPDSEADLAGQIVRLALEPDLAEVMGNRGRLVAESSFDWAQRIEEWDRMLLKELGARVPSPISRPFVLGAVQP